MPPASTRPRCRLICLTGFMGCGKTTVGRLLARQIGWRFVDLDTRIEEHADLTINQIFERHGEPVFREIEYARLLHALGEATEQDLPTVLALGGGTLAQPRNTELLSSFGATKEPAEQGAGSVVIWLDCPIEVLLTRCAIMTHRPLFRDEASFRKLYEERLPYYQRADYRVESTSDPRRVVEQILALGFLEHTLRAADPSAGRVNA